MPCETIGCLDVWWKFDCYYVVYNFIKHDKPCVKPSVFQGPPAQLILHGCYTQMGRVRVLHPSDGSSLDLLNFVYVGLGMWAPYCGGVLNLGSD